MPRLMILTNEHRLLKKYEEFQIWKRFNRGTDELDALWTPERRTDALFSEAAHEGVLEAVPHVARIAEDFEDKVNRIIEEGFRQLDIRLREIIEKGDRVLRLAEEVRQRAREQILFELQRAHARTQIELQQIQESCR